MDGIPHYVATPNRSISDLYEACRASVAKYRKSHGNREARLFKMLGSALELHRLSKETSENAAELNKLLKDKRIRITERTQNPFTPIVNLIFKGGVIENEKSLVMRCASILRLADSMNIEPDGIAAFVDEQGGIVQCYKLDREMHPATGGNSTKPDPITALRENARNCDSTALRYLVPDGPITALLEIDHDGNILLLGARTATPTDIRWCKTVGKSPTSSPDDAATGTPDVALIAVAQAEPAPPS